MATNTNSTSTSRTSKLTLAESILRAIPTATNTQLHAVLNSTFGSSVRNSALASVRRSTRTVAK